MYSRKTTGMLKLFIAHDIRQLALVRMNIYIYIYYVCVNMLNKQDIVQVIYDLNNGEMSNTQHYDWCKGAPPFL